jgi:hypothetical protein
MIEKLDNLLEHFPKPISRQLHATFDLINFPNGLVSTLVIAKRKKNAGAVMAMDTIVKSGVSFFIGIFSHNVSTPCCPNHPIIMSLLHPQKVTLEC